MKTTFGHFHRKTALFITGLTVIFSLSCRENTVPTSTTQNPYATPMDTIDPVDAEDIFNTKTHTFDDLSTMEQDMVNEFFNNALDASKILKVKGPPSATSAAYVPRQYINMVVFCGDAYYEDDFTKTQTPAHFHTFFHEVFHLWQKTNNTPMNITPEPKSRYLYDVFEHDHLFDFYYEHQAAIIGDYAMRFLYTKDAGYKYTDDVTPEKDAKIIQLVEEVFPNAQKMRERNARLKMALHLGKQFKL